MVSPVGRQLAFGLITILGLVKCALGSGATAARSPYFFAQLINGTEVQRTQRTGLDADRFFAIRDARVAAVALGHMPFGGIALSTPKVMGFDAYASYVAGKDFNETQVGVNKNLLLNVDLNVNYHNFKPDEGSRENGVGVGVSVKF